MGIGAGGAGRQRRCRDGRFGRPLHPDACRQPRDPGVQPRPRRRSGRRHRRHPVAQSAARRRLQVQPAQRRARRHRRDRGDRQAGQRDPARRAQGREAGTAGPGAADRAAPRLYGRLRRGPAERGRRARHQRREDPHRRRPAGRGQRRLLGRDRRAAQPRADGGQPAGRRDVAVHDARHRRQDPDGLQFAQRDGVADRQPRLVSDRRPATTPTPTGTASSPPTAAC